MKKLLAFFNFHFIVSLALIVLMLALVWNSVSANKRADEESNRADEVIALLQRENTEATASRQKINDGQIELIHRYTTIESANKALLDWLNDNHITVPTRIVRMFVYTAPKVSNPPTTSTYTSPGHKTKHHKPPVAKESSKSHAHHTERD